MRIQPLSLLATSALALLLWGGLAQAALHDRGNGLIYDDVLNVTWLQDANLAATETFGVSGIDPDGRFPSCDLGRIWIDAMNAAHYKGINDWQLPDVSPVDGSTSYNHQLSYDGSTDSGFNISAAGSAYPGSQASHLAHLHYQTLGNQGWYDVNGNRNTSACPDDANGCLRNTGPLINMQPGFYLSSFCEQPLGGVPAPVSLTMVFSFRSGQQAEGDVPPAAGQNFYLLPYHPGDVADLSGAKGVPTLSFRVLIILNGLLLMLGAYRLRNSSNC
ncbi:hypothetical protein [Thiolapillus brandeum]|nr:hypothetical protein [Thiolapillus brandeum]